MSSSLIQEVLEPLQSMRLIDPHTHINPHQLASKTLADILGYHYYTELLHSSGMPKSQIEEPGLAPKEKVGRLIPWLTTIENTGSVQLVAGDVSGLLGFQEERLTVDNWEALYDRSLKQMQAPNREQQVLGSFGA